ncbi:NAD(P)H-dependent glycerol-3-phosphate dehydrogenase [Pararhodobacter sp. SW119]|uniref:NAD(P)H-dependent glycerol-3-phosphate dehydrogenase n=1 Tax=Pararhodobacter sp. SW119 TaxID=2780075 RepID=UPI001ADF0C94|nr:NAD(P)H-dependent glycerol-3-phosphate dehydrogenase [Pararhodobacter sp. SW119]
MAERIGVIGAGAFGTALAVAQAAAGREVALWLRDPAAAAEMAEGRENRARLPGVRLPPGVVPTADIANAAREIVLLAVPTQRLREVLQAQAERLAGCTLVACCKGVELGTGLLPTEVIADVLPGARVAVLTGPSFAADIARGKPTALTLAATAPGAEALQEALSTRSLRLYLTGDLTGAQMGGALKNVIAIAAGVSIGAGLGESARAALMTRGFAEMTRHAEARGADSETLHGLSGLGDLVLTCTSEKSRNYRHGLALGAGRPPEAGATVEGVATARALAAAAPADALPVTAMVAALVDGKVTLADAVELLLSRPLKRERE